MWFCHPRVAAAYRGRREKLRPHAYRRVGRAGESSPLAKFCCNVAGASGRHTVDRGEEEALVLQARPVAQADAATGATTKYQYLTAKIRTAATAARVQAAEAEAGLAFFRM